MAFRDEHIADRLAAVRRTDLELATEVESRLLRLERALLDGASSWVTGQDARQARAFLAVLIHRLGGSDAE